MAFAAVSYLINFIRTNFKLYTMKFKKIALCGWLLVQISLSTASAQGFSDTTSQKAPENWFNLDPAENSMYGVSTEKAYTLLKNKPSKTVIVGVIDSGIDVDHEDLKDNIWVNEKETPGNGVDDDKNGYVDDVHGWNFLGGKDGKNINEETYELTREYIRLKERFEGKKAKKNIRKDKEGYDYYQTIKNEYESKVQELKETYEEFSKFYAAYQAASEFMKDYLKKDTLTIEDVQSVNATTQQLNGAKAILLYVFTNNMDENYFKAGEEYFTNGLKYGYNLDFNPRTIVGDDPGDVKERNYGNNDVTGPDAKHGTHVAGIIAAERDNSLGIKGVADNVKIMVLRAVPNGDERDKDVANAIYYAVDNGAKVINMSFGKDYSPHKEAVDAAVKYAASKGVLLVHGAGNDARNVDEGNNFPNRKLAKDQKEAPNWIEVGASSWGDSTNFVGNFSNYGKESVDLFAPGVDIYSTTPGQKYENQSGTSMAAPVVTGVAALLMSYFPDLTVEQIKEVMINSTVKFTDSKVNKPAEGPQKGEMVEFSELSRTGGIINTYEAVKMAENLSGQSK
jgi:cell wall-associated protease